MLRATTKFATIIMAGALVIAGPVYNVNAQTVYDNTAVAGITIPVGDYIPGMDTAAIQQKTENTSKASTTQTSSNSKYVVAKVDDELNIRKKASTKADVVGILRKGNEGTLISKGKTWSKIKSGKVTGFVKNEYLVYGDSAVKYAKKVCDTVAVVKADGLNIREKDSKKADVLTSVEKGSELLVKKSDEDWVKVKIAGQTGYVSADFVKVKLDTGKAITIEQRYKEIQKAAEKAVADAAAASTNSTSSTSTSSSSSNSSSSSKSYNAPSGSTGASVAQFALQFVGNPYVWGGTSLTNGADCSGFVMSVYAKFGVGLPRVASAQASAGRSVSTSNLQPGDLVFYSHGGGIDHVAIYVGGGTVVHASTTATGIKTSPYNYNTPVKAVRIFN